MASKMIEVTQECIDHGKPLSGSRCAIALALENAGFDVRSVNGWGVNLRSQSNVMWQHIPDKARTFMNRFDNDKPVKPFSFRFNPDRPSRRF